MLSGIGGSALPCKLAISSSGRYADISSIGTHSFHTTSLKVVGTSNQNPFVVKGPFVTLLVFIYRVLRFTCSSKQYMLHAGDVAPGNRSHPNDWKNVASNIKWIQNHNQSRPFFAYQVRDFVDVLWL
jgi:hypothetical protein